MATAQIAATMLRGNGSPSITRRDLAFGTTALAATALVSSRAGATPQARLEEVITALERRGYCFWAKKGSDSIWFGSPTDGGSEAADQAGDGLRWWIHEHPANRLALIDHLMATGRVVVGGIK